MFRDLFLKWLPPILWAALIFYLSTIPDLRSELSNTWDFVLRKITHILEYAVLAILLARAWPKRKYIFGEVLAAVFLYAVSDEIHQLFVAGRSGSFYDVTIDFSGGLLGMILYFRNIFRL